MTTPPVPDAQPVVIGSTAVYSWDRVTVYVEDHTGSRWPVTTAVREWDAGTTVRVVYGRCVRNMPCVRVYEGAYGATGWLGKTWFPGLVKLNGAWRLRGVATVKLNDSYRRSVHDYAQAACHELGHALGIMGHDTSLSTCLHFQIDARASVHPANGDRARLNTAYRGTR